MEVYLIYLFLLICLKSFAANILIPCEIDDDCKSIIKDTTCSLILGGYCTCPAGYTFSTDARSCLKEALYGEKCSEGNQCSHMLSGARCNVVCECAEGYTYMRGKCRQLVNLNSACRDEIDCFFGFNRESVECRESKCQCANGFYQRFTNVCRRELNNGERCVVNADCIESTDSTCSNFVCSSSVGTQTSSKKNVSVQTTQSLESISNSVPKRKARNFIKYSILKNIDATKFSFDDESTQFGESCESEHKPCPGLKYSLCRRGFCQCQDGFYEKDGICKAELGELVEEAKYCGSGSFTNSRCVCQTNQFYNPNMRTCTKAATGINNSCTQPAQCSPYGAAYCSVPNPRQCRCYDYALYNEKTELCELKKGLGEFCESSEGCKIENTECSDRKTCECKSNFIAQNDICKPGKLAPCEKTDDCAFDNAECKIKIIDELKTEKRCDCKDKFASVGDTCLEEAKNYNDTCTDSEQCKPLLGEMSSCNENKCSCSEELHFKGGKCNAKKELNEQCVKSAECYVAADPETVECRNGICHCKFNYSRDSTQNRCRPREKNSSSSVSPLKVITLMLIGSAVIVTSSALKDAYFP